MKKMKSIPVPDYINLKEEIMFILNDENEIFSQLDNKKIRVLIKFIEKSFTSIIDGIDFYKKSSFENLSLSDLYEKSFYYSKIEENNIYNEILRNSNLVKEFQINDLLTISKNINNKIDLNSYYKESKFKNSKVFSIIKPTASKNDIYYAINKISRIINNEFAFLPPLINSEYTQDFINNKLYRYDIDSLPINIISSINNKHNGHIIAKYKKGKLLNIFDLYNSIKLVTNKKKTFELYNSLEGKILDEYLENISNLKLYKDSFSFLEKILVSDIYNKLSDIVVSQADLQTWLKSIKLILLKYLNYTNLNNTLSILDTKEKSLIEFCFNSTNSYKKLYDLMHYIPIYCIDRNIKELEVSRREYFESNFFNINFKSAHIAFNNLKKILSKYYNEVDHLKNIALIADSKFNSIDKIDVCSKTSSNKYILEKKITSLLKSLKYKFQESYTEEYSYRIRVDSSIFKERSVWIYFIHNCYFDFNNLLNLVISTPNPDNILFVNHSEFWTDEKNALINFKNTLYSILCE